MNFRTKDFILACTLYAYNFKYIGSEKDSNKNTVFFTFDTTGKENIYYKIIDDFINQECMVNIKKYSHASKILREEIKKHIK